MLAAYKPVRLNPCFSGRYAGRMKLMTLQKESIGLNPCFSGRYAGRGVCISD